MQNSLRIHDRSTEKYLDSCLLETLALLLQIVDLLSHILQFLNEDGVTLLELFSKSRLCRCLLADSDDLAFQLVWDGIAIVEDLL
jgi:hypothetical protein